MVESECIAQEKAVQQQLIIADTEQFFTRFTFLPIKDNSLEHLDTSLAQIHKANKIYRTQEDFYQQLSTEGSAHKSLTFSLPEVSNFEYRPNIYSALWLTRENIRFYNTKKAYSQLYYSNTLNSSRYFSVTHAQNVYKNLQIGLQYDVNYSNGSFDKSEVRNQFFCATTRYVSSNKHYEAYAAYIRNRAMQSESGGLASDSAFEHNIYSSLSAYPVNLSSSYSKDKSYEALCSQKVIFGFFNASYDISFGTQARVFVDSVAAKDSLYTRHFSQVFSLSNQALLPLTIGIRHDYIIHSDKTNEERVNNATPFFSLALPVKSFALTVNGEYVFSSGRYNNDCQMSAIASLKGFYIKAQSVRKSVDYFYSQYTSKYYNWSNAFEKEQYLSFSSGLKFGQWLNVSLAYYGMNNVAYIGSDLLAHQATKATHLLQANAKYDINVGRWEFLGNVCVQKISSDQAIRVPIFQTKQTSLINFSLFNGRLATQAGVDCRYNTAYYAYGYSPSQGAFYVQDKTQIGNYIFADAFIQARIQRFELAFSITHPYGGLAGYKYYNTIHYPNENLQLRLSICWRFWD
jgi:hypothetical protein